MQKQNLTKLSDFKPANDKIVGIKIRLGFIEKYCYNQKLFDNHSDKFVGNEQRQTRNHPVNNSHFE